MASPLVTAISRQHAIHAIGNGRDVASFPVLLFTQGLPAVINKIDSKLDVEILTNESGLAPMISRLVGYDKDKNIILPSESEVSEYIYGISGYEVEVPAGYKDKRAPGESLYPESTDIQRAMMRLDWALKNVTTKAQRDVILRTNLKFWETLVTGEMVIADEHEGAKKLVWPRDATLKNRTVGVLWSTPATSTPWTDLGSASKAIKRAALINGNYNAIDIMGTTAFNNMKDAYRAQKSQTVEPELFNEFKFTKAVLPDALKFLANSGLTYRGWVFDDENTEHHVFTCDYWYKNDSGVTTEMVGLTDVTVCLYNPFDYRAYFGPGTKMPKESFYEQEYNPIEKNTSEFLNSPVMDQYINSGVPIKAIDSVFYDLGKASGVGGTVEIAYLPCLKNANTVATIDITTATEVDDDA